MAFSESLLYHLMDSCPRMRSEAFSASIILVASMLPEMASGKMLASAIRRLVTFMTLERDEQNGKLIVILVYGNKNEQSKKWYTLLF